MGFKGKAKTKAKKQVKAVAKKMGKKVGVAQASRIAKKAEQTGIDVGALAQSALGGIPLVGGLASELLGQSGILTPSEGGAMSGSRGGKRGVQMIDASTGLNLGTVSRKRALRMLTRTRFPTRSRRVAILKTGEQVVRL